MLRQTYVWIVCAVGTVLSGIAGCYQLAGGDSDGGESEETRLDRLSVGEALSNISDGYEGLLNVRGRLPQISLQIPDGQKYGGINWYNAMGERLITMVADAPDYELSIYTKPDEQGSGNTQPIKALDINYGTKLLSVDWKNINKFHVLGPEAGLSDENVRFVLQPQGSAGNAHIQFTDHTGAAMWSSFMDANNDNAFHLYNHHRGDPVLSVDPETNAIGFNGNPLTQLRELSEPTEIQLQEWAWDMKEERWLYRDSKGTIHYFNPDGAFDCG
jgi:hypothetical protein